MLYVCRRNKEWTFTFSVYGGPFYSWPTQISPSKKAATAILKETLFNEVMEIVGQSWLWPIRLHINICSFSLPLVPLNFLHEKHKGNRSKDAFYLSYLVLVLHIFQLLFQIGECRSYIRVILPAFQHYLMPRINRQELKMNEIICFLENYLCSKYQLPLLKV